MKRATRIELAFSTREADNRLRELLDSDLINLHFPGMYFLLQSHWALGYRVSPLL
jgi:hypothetical protein